MIEKQLPLASVQSEVRVECVHPTVVDPVEGVDPVEEVELRLSRKRRVDRSIRGIVRTPRRIRSTWL